MLRVKIDSRKIVDFCVNLSRFLCCVFTLEAQLSFMLLLGDYNHLDEATLNLRRTILFSPLLLKMAALILSLKPVKVCHFLDQAFFLGGGGGKFTFLIFRLC
jgi:hypothetical protein